jgi:CHAD domain-containing protein
MDAAMAKKKSVGPALAAAPGDGSIRVESAIREQQRLLAAAAVALETAGVEDVHQSRVAARRLRSLLKTFRPLLEPRRARLYRVDLRSFARSLAAVREADVRRDMLVDLARENEAVPADDRARLRVLLDDLCIAAREGLRRHLREPGWTALRRALERHAASEALFVDRDASLARVLTLVDRAWRIPVRMLREHPKSAIELHELRLALKHCRYALEPVADRESRAAARLMRRLRAAQDRIGQHRDTLLAEHWVRLNERSLGRVLTAQLVRDLARRERILRRQAARRAEKVLPGWREWRQATRHLRRESRRDRR